MKKTYTHLLFDLDGTLFDFHAAEHIAFQKTCEQLSIPYNTDIMKAYERINESYWKKFEKGLVTQAELAVLRFADLYTYCHLTGDAQLANKTYRSYLAEGNQLIEHAVTVLDALKTHYEIAYITNGITDVQYGRLSRSVLSQYTKNVFVSEEVGYQKPQKAYFDIVYKKLGIQSTQALIIGDSLTSDIKGANQSAADSCWFNPSKLINTHTDIQPTYEIDGLPQLLPLLLPHTL